MKLTAYVGEKSYGYFDCPRFSVNVQQTTTWNKSVAIEIRFSYHDDWIYKGGFLEISPEVAQWLGTALIAAAEGKLQQKGLSADVHNDKQITEPKKLPAAKIIKAMITDPK